MTSIVEREVLQYQIEDGHDDLRWVQSHPIELVQYMGLRVNTIDQPVNITSTLL